MDVNSIAFIGWIFEGSEAIHLGHRVIANGNGIGMAVAISKLKISGNFLCRPGARFTFTPWFSDGAFLN